MGEPPGGDVVHPWRRVPSVHAPLLSVPPRLRGVARGGLRDTLLDVSRVTIFTGNYQTKTKHMKRYIVIRIIGVVLLVVGAALIILQIMEGGKSVIQTIGAGGPSIAVGGALFGLSLRLENKEKAAGDPSDRPE